ncbi:MAG: hypothetical protein AAF614_07140 [Chloroflexota bacterium]
MFWILAASYWLHLLATAVWLISLALTLFLALPAWQQNSLTNNQWWQWQKRLLLWTNTSLVILLLTGFYQMTSDPNYGGFLAVDGIWAWAMLFKHIAYVGIVAIAAYMQFSLHPAMERLTLLGNKTAAQAKLQQQEQRLLRLNLICAVLVLLFTAIATAV